MDNQEMQKNTSLLRSLRLKIALLIAWLVVFTAIFLYFAIEQLIGISSLVSHKMTSTTFFTNTILVLIGVITLFISFVILTLQKILNRGFYLNGNHNVKILLILYAIWSAICSAIFIGILVYFIGALVEYSRQMSIANSLEEKSFLQNSIISCAFYLAYTTCVFCSFLSLAILKTKNLLLLRIKHRKDIPIQ